MDLSVITVTWNSEELIGTQIRSVFFACKDTSFEQIVVDNGSKDKTTLVVKSEFPKVTLVKNIQNNGFGAANNQGVGMSNGEYILFLNPDMRLQEGSLDRIIAWMRKRPNVGIASCRLVDEEGKENMQTRPRRFPSVLDMIVLILKLHHVFPSLLNRYRMSNFDSETEQTVDSVRGSFLLVRREVVAQLGWAFDPRYFIWFEDVDLCREAHRLGFRVVYTPVISCVDYVGQSFKKRETLWKQKQFTKSMLIYAKKWEPWYKWIWVALLRPAGIGLAWIRGFLTK